MRNASPPHEPVTAEAGRVSAPLHLVGGCDAPHLLNDARSGAVLPATHGTPATNGPALDDFVEFRTNNGRSPEIGRVTCITIGPRKITKGNVTAISFAPLIEVMDSKGQHHEIGTAYRTLNEKSQINIANIWSIWVEDL